MSEAAAQLPSVSKPGAGAANAQPFCVHCVSGDVLPGESKGKESKIGPYNTYIASPSSTRSSTVGIIFACDAFGLALKNNKILADTLADKLGTTVYVPDYFQGDPVKPEVMNDAPGTAKEVNAQSFFQKAASSLKLVSMVPWFIKHRPSTKYDGFKAFVKALTEEKKLEKLGAVGYCYGGKMAAYANVNELVQAAVLLHPSLISVNDDIKPLKAPTLFLCAESDPVFPDKLREQSQSALATRGSDAPAHEFVLYENTVHGFGARPKLSDPLVKKAFEQSVDRTVEWFQTHLLT
ncbi:Predicted hydrolase related to dienelactone hydrolase [Ceraceosorus bombacis]|uniref:Predicted hydrolase related to dienelactone hydrolase n=1 Tax=Ceraceosorus bombacis TaxID=401625 RepID=A0A0N7L8X1_9BASI|nr:Predicted hydrolase related to dienelactone hydrolase [Ceraceosorus bombacis]